MTTPLSEMTEEEILIQIETIRARRLIARQSGLKVTRVKKEKILHIPKTNVDVVTGELSDILGRLLNGGD